MNVAWICPREERCGIALYSRRYTEALRAHATVECLDPAGYPEDPALFAARVNRCDLAHIQYEPSFFAHSGRDFFTPLCRAIGIPIVVGLHEVYGSFPDAYPREAINGRGPVALLRRTIYDRRHPLQTAYRRHAARSFFAGRVLVHCGFQREILTHQGCRADVIGLLPHPVVVDAGATSVPGITPDGPLRIAASGFINPHFDYDLLFATLDQVAIPWTFTWIGGVRREEDAVLRQNIIERIAARGWNDRFTVTGWVSDAELSARLREADIVCAFFTARSSSGSLAAALGALRPVIATPIPLTEELARDGIVHLAAADPIRLATEIERLARDAELRSSLVSSVAAYRERYSYPAQARQLTGIYRDLLAAPSRRMNRP